MVKVDLGLVGADGLEQREVVRLTLDYCARLGKCIAEIFDEQVTRLCKSPSAILGYDLALIAVENVNQGKRGLVLVVELRCRIQGDHEFERQVCESQNVPGIAEDGAPLLGETDALIGQVVREHVACGCKIGIGMNAAVKANETHAGLRGGMAAAPAHNHGPRTVIVEAEMGQLVVALGADELVAAPEIAFRALEGAAEVVQV